MGVIGIDELLAGCIAYADFLDRIVRTSSSMQPEEM